jgi:ADP-heptose:LPS heptosyltransferase
MKILIVQLRRVGDILLTTPVVAYLKQVFPDAQIHFLAEPMGKTILESNPLLDRLIFYDKTSPLQMIKQARRERYDVVIDFMNNPRSGYLTMLSGAKWRVGWRHPIRKIFYNSPIDIPSAPEYVPRRKLRLVQSWLMGAGYQSPTPVKIRPEIYLTSQDEAVADQWMQKEKLERGGFVVFVPIPRHPLRGWRIEGFQKVALDLIQKRGKRVYLTWGPGEEAQVAKVRLGFEDKIGLLPLTSIREMAAIFKRAAFVLTNESGSMHVAVAVGAPTVTLYGPTRPIDWNPSLAGVGPLDIPLNAPDVDCLGCHLTTNCPVGHICMKNLTEERVFAACEKILNTK